VECVIIFQNYFWSIVGDDFTVQRLARVRPPPHVPVLSDFHPLKLFMTKTLLRPALLFAAGIFLAIGANAQSTTLNFTVTQPAELLADAGADVNACVGQSEPIGGSPTASGGTSPFAYAWTPSTNLSSATAANPDATPTAIGTTTYTVVVTDDRGCTASDAVDVIADTCTAVTNAAGLGTWTLYPNPNNGTFAVEIESVKQLSFINISVYAIDGRKVYENNLNLPQMKVRDEIRLTGLSSGTYTVTVNLEGTVLSRNVVVQ
jgi:hypothetical protein